MHAPPLENTSSVSLADMVSLSLQHTYRNLHGTIERLDLNDGSRRSIVVVQSEERISDELRRWCKQASEQTNTHMHTYVNLKYIYIYINIGEDFSVL